MRVHGCLKITRRQMTETRDYKKYEKEVREDFCGICGYCGKSERVSKKGFEIDHFVPQDTDSTRRNDYNNLVYSCFTCNRKKSSKWPTNDPNKPNDGVSGLVDPASEEYDLHLQRDTNGAIVPLSDLGKYMIKKVFLFHKRPTSTVWKAMEICRLKDKLAQKADRLSIEEYQAYISIDKELTELLNYLFEKRE